MFYGNTALFTNDKKSFYRTYVINDTFFKSGRRIQFNTDSENLNIDNVTTNLSPEFYIVKLLHQLDNGILDLTEDIWEQFIKHKNTTGDSATHWLTSSTFFYYCPTRFKGKLLLQIIFDEPEYFRFSNSPKVEFVTIADESEINPKEYSHKVTFNLE